MTNRSEVLAPLVRCLERLATLSRDDVAALLALPFTLRTADAGSYLVRDSQPPTTCAVLLAGFAFRQKLTSDGLRQIVSLHIPGDPLDFQNLFLDIADHNVQTLMRAELAVIPRDAIRELSRTRPSVLHAILLHTLVEASIFREWVLNVGRRNARTSIAHLLCEFTVRLDAQQTVVEAPYELPMTQEQLGDALGITSVHVNRTLRVMEAEGLITRDKRRVTIADWEKLQAVADFNSRYLHLDQQPSR